MLLLVSVIMIIIYTIVLCINGAKKSDVVSATSGKCVAMSYGMISGTAIGLFAGIYLQGQLAYSTVSSIGISIVLGYFVGRIFGLSGIIEALAASFMGAMMGAMLGEMLAPTNQLFMMIMIDLMYALVVTGLLFMINTEHTKTTKSKVKLAPLLILLLFSISSVSLIAALDHNSVDVEQDSTAKMNPEHHH